MSKDFGNIKISKINENDKGEIRNNKKKTLEIKMQKLSK